MNKSQVVESPTQVLETSSGNLFRYDGPAGTVVFLVALPLCLGIALASGAPLFSGIIAGIIGGTVVALLSGSHVSVSGPAAGLAVIVATGISTLGSFQAFTTAVVIAGAMQFMLGMFKAGVIAQYVPNSVIKGMLAAIGVLIILKQIPHALGRDKDWEGDLSFFAIGGENALTDIAAAVMSASPGAVAITAVSLVILFFWDKLGKKNKFFKLIPGALVTVLLGIGMNQALGLIAPAWKLVDASHLVNLPVPESMAAFFSNFVQPDFNAITNQKVWILAVTLALVASLETLLSLEAADRLDPYKRISPPNRELLAQGTGNFLSGLIGGLPITSVVVRTSANVYAGSRTKMSALIHGVLLMGSTLLIPSLLNLTPLASLAVVLLAVGYKLTNPELYKKMYKSGLHQFIPFIVTIAAVVFTDLLVGVLIGMTLGLFFVIRENHHEAVSVVHQDNDYLMRFNKDMTFVNKSELRSKLRKLPGGARVLIDGSKALYIDHDIYEAIEDFQQLAPYKGINVELKHMESRLAPAKR
ncbi:MAG: SulP family inorganic anion transporter [Bryobacteraceae bacterium]|nr:SulP family inorganic anion transporter [Bryobacteraceae bacterium]